MQILWFFVRGILARLWTLIPAILTDPFDVLEKGWNVNIPLPQWVFYVLLGAGIAIAFILTLQDYIKHGYIKLNPEYITDQIWKVYKEGQSVVIRIGKKGLPKSKFNEIKDELKEELNVPTIPIKKGFTLNKKEGDYLLETVTEKMGNRMRSDTRFDADTFHRLAKMAQILDTNEAGLLAITKDADDYQSSEYELGRRRASVTSQKEIRQTVGVGYILNSILLSFCFFSPLAKQVMPNNKLPVNMMKQALDELMLDYMKDLVKVLRRRG